MLEIESLFYLQIELRKWYVLKGTIRQNIGDVEDIKAMGIIRRHKCYPKTMANKPVKKRI